MKKAWTVFLLFLAAFSLTIVRVQSQKPDAGEGGRRAARSRIRRAQKPVKDHYIVVLKDEVEEWELEERANEMAWAHGAAVRDYYKYALKGFSIQLNEQAAEALSHHPLVNFVEEDDEGEPSGTQYPTPSWGLDRIDQRYLPLDNTYHSLGDGTGVKAFVIDTGINYTHQDFGGRVNGNLSRDFVNDPNDGFADDDNYGYGDCNGHGTGVASVLGGTKYGVAKNVTLISVRVGNCNGSGFTSRKLKGLNYVAQIAGNVKPAVVNYSWNNVKPTDSNDPDAAIGVAVLGVINKGITVVNSAGNNNSDARNYTPSYLDAALVVGASDSTDTRAYFSTSPTFASSNYGTSVDLYAPGKDITCAGHLSSTATQVRSGTSFAAPHVGGAAAIHLQSSRSSTPVQVADYLRFRATGQIVKNVPLGTQRLLYTGPATARSIIPFPWQLIMDSQKRA